MERTESYWTRALMQYLTENHHSWLYYKLADQFTSGIADVVVCAEYRSTWVELKLLRENQTIVQRINMKSDRHAKLQLHDLVKIQENGCPAYFVFFLPGLTLRYVMVPALTVKLWVDGQQQEPSLESLSAWSVSSFASFASTCRGRYLDAFKF